MSQVTQTSKKIISNIETVVVGKRRQIVLTLVSLFCEGHLLLEDVPGVAKTILARALAASIGCKFKRMQCTPDLLPTDVTGTSVFNQKTAEFEFRPGPIFANIALADEINRATPRTQAALLEAMAEASVSIDGTTYKLDEPFFVIATQNPIDHEGTFALPEAQLDRFFMKFGLGYPTMDEEIQMLAMLQHEHPIHSIKPVATAEEIVVCRKAVREIRVDEKVVQYLTSLVHCTREHEDLALGGSPRASIALYRASQGLAAIQGRDYVIPDDVQHIASPVLSHRMIIRPECRLQKITAEMVVKEVMERVPVPTHRQ